MGMVLRRICLSAPALALGACTIVERTDRDGDAQANVENLLRREVVETGDVVPFSSVSPAVRSGGLLFVSGQIGTRPGVEPPELVEGGIGAQTRQAMENVGTILAAVDAGFDDVLKCTLFLSDIEDHDAVDQAYLEYFATPPPARSALATSGLPLGALVEIECIAALP